MMHRLIFIHVDLLLDKPIKTQVLCAHCGDKCLEGIIASQEASFCCAGCQTVYHILHDHQLTHFYSMDIAAGLSQKYIRKEQYEYLDEAETQEKLCNYISTSTISIWLSLPTIHCTSCIWLIENLSRINGGIKHASVNYLEKRALIHFDPSRISLRQVAVLLSQLGYPPLITLHDTEQTKEKKDRSIYYKIGISGFVFGNIMLLSFPEYLGMNPFTDSMSLYIRMINVILVMPVILYCARDYYRSSYQSFKQKHLNIDLPITIGITALLVKSLYDIMAGTGPGYFDSLSGLIFFLLIGKWVQHITYSRIKFDLDYRSYFPVAATKVVDGLEIKVSLNKIVPKDILRIRHGELIPTDGQLLSPQATIDYSFVTGEEDPVIIEEEDNVYSGGKVIGPMVEIEVEKSVVTSYLTQLWNDANVKPDHNTGNISAINTAVAKYFTICILIIAVGSFWYHSSYGIDQALHVFTSVLIIACPCAIALSIPFTFGNIIRLLALRHIFFKNTNVVEKCAAISAVVFDKTGTITTHKSKQINYVGLDLSSHEKRAIHSIAIHSTHSVCQILCKYYSDYEVITATDIEEITGKGIQGRVNLKMIRIGSADFFGQNEIWSFKHQFPNDESYSAYIWIDNKLVGAIMKKSHFIDELSTLINTLSDDKDISLISGDNDNDKPYLQKVFNRWSHLLFNKSPIEKLHFIKQLSLNHKVAMVGDGLNDAGALMQSDVGIAVSQDASHFTPASDMIINNEQIYTLPDIFSVCRSAVRIIYASYAIAICYNIIGLSYAIQGLLSPIIAAILMPVSSITVVVFGYILSTVLVKRHSL